MALRLGLQISFFNSQKHLKITNKLEMRVMSWDPFATLLPSTFSIPKEGKTSATLKDSSLFGISLCDHVKSVFGSTFKIKSGRKSSLGAIRAKTLVPHEKNAPMTGNKTLRKGFVVITGDSSRLGLATAKALAETRKWHVIMACGDFHKAEREAKSAGIPKENYTIMHLDLTLPERVRQFVDDFRRSGHPLDVLVCNATVYQQPTAKEPSFTAEGFELSVGTNHLGHFLLSRLLLDDLKKSDYPSKRLIIVGSITDGGDFDGAKAYRDIKDCNMLTMQEFHRRYHKETGITFASLYPGCIATTGLFHFHVFRKSNTKGFVSEAESGKKLAQLVSDPSLKKSGVYWSWNKNSSSFENQFSEEASDPEKARKVWEDSEKLVGLA